MFEKLSGNIISDTSGTQPHRTLHAAEKATRHTMHDWWGQGWWCPPLPSSRPTLWQTLSENNLEKASGLNQAHGCVLFGQKSFQIWKISVFSFSDNSTYLSDGSREQLSLGPSPHGSLIPVTAWPSFLKATCLIPVLDAFLEYKTVRYAYVCFSHFPWEFFYVRDRGLASLFRAKP